MATCLFRSALAFRLRNFWELRVAAGRRGIYGQKLLLYLDRFLVGEVKPGGTITLDIVERYIRSIEHLSVGSRINRLSVLRQFCQYLSHFDPRTCLVHRSYLPHRTRPAPHIYRRQEVQNIIVAARRLGPRGSLRPFVVSTMVGLLYASGLRIGEAVRLTLGDVDFRRRVLLIRETKFKKSRYVPFSASCAKQLHDYLLRRRKAGF